MELFKAFSRLTKRKIYGFGRIRIENTHVEFVRRNVNANVNHFENPPFNIPMIGTVSKAITLKRDKESDPILVAGFYAWEMNGFLHILDVSFNNYILHGR